MKTVQRHVSDIMHIERIWFNLRLFILNYDVIIVNLYLGLVLSLQ